MTCQGWAGNFRYEGGHEFLLELSMCTARPPPPHDPLMMTSLIDQQLTLGPDLNLTWGSGVCLVRGGMTRLHFIFKTKMSIHVMKSVNVKF